MREEKRVVLGHMWTEDIPEGKKGLSGSTLKLIAVLSMVIDHFAASALALARKIHFGGKTPIGLFIGSKDFLILYRVMRYIGRIAFPIYCFMLVEGISRTRSKGKYVMRLFLFAVLSEIPFDLAIYQKIFYWGHQNVFFELALGVLGIWLIQILREKMKNFWVPFIGVSLVSAVVAELAGFDYGYMGIGCIMLLYLFCYAKVDQMIAGAVSFSWELTAPIAFLFLYFYNGKRGLQWKYFFYVIYPAHLLLYAGICYWMIH